MIKKGFTISIPNIIATKYPINNKAIKLNKRVMSNPKKSSFNRSDFWIFGDNVPIYRCVVNRDTRTVDISPIKEFKAGIIKSNIGIVVNSASLEDNKVPEISPNNEDKITMIMDSLKIFM